MRLRTASTLAALPFAHHTFADAPTGIDQHIAQGFRPVADAVSGFVFAAIFLVLFLKATVMKKSAVGEGK